VRFAHDQVDHQTAVTNSCTLFEAAAQAGVQRIVHLSITRPSLDSPYPYFRGKAEVEQILAELGVSYAIARPAILFGGDGVLVNNVAWLLPSPVGALIHSQPVRSCAGGRCSAIGCCKHSAHCPDRTADMREFARQSRAISPARHRIPHLRGNRARSSRCRLARRTAGRAHRARVR
jgi:hypothetical protein